VLILSFDIFFSKIVGIYKKKAFPLSPNGQDILTTDPFGSPILRPAAARSIFHYKGTQKLSKTSFSQGIRPLLTGFFAALYPATAAAGRPVDDPVDGDTEGGNDDDAYYYVLHWDASAVRLTVTSIVVKETGFVFGTRWLKSSWFYSQPGIRFLLMRNNNNKARRLSHFSLTATKFSITK
jgi:hypothetical protein